MKEEMKEEMKKEMKKEMKAGRRFTSFALDFAQQSNFTYIDDNVNHIVDILSIGFRIKNDASDGVDTYHMGS